MIPLIHKKILAKKKSLVWLFSEWICVKWYASSFLSIRYLLHSSQLKINLLRTKIFYLTYFAIPEIEFLKNLVSTRSSVPRIPLSKKKKRKETKKKKEKVTISPKYSHPPRNHRFPEHEHQSLSFPPTAYVFEVACGNARNSENRKVRS